MYQMYFSCANEQGNSPNSLDNTMVFKFWRNFVKFGSHKNFFWSLIFFLCYETIPSYEKVRDWKKEGRCGDYYVSYIGQTKQIGTEHLKQCSSSGMRRAKTRQVCRTRPFVRSLVCVCITCNLAAYPITLLIPTTWWG